MPGSAAGIALTVLLAWVAGADDARSSGRTRPRFRPVLASIQIANHLVRPGDPLSYTPLFANEGTGPADRDLTVFVHLEPAGGDCRTIVAQHDHEPRTPTRTWDAAAAIVDGPRLMTIPADMPEGGYELHVGLFDRGGSGARCVEARSAPLRVACDAPAAGSWRPRVAAAEPVRAHESRSTERMRSAAFLEGATWAFALDASGGGWALEDRRDGELWTADPDGRTALIARVEGPIGVEDVEVPRFERLRASAGALELEARVPMRARRAAARVTLRVEPTEDGEGVRWSWRAQGDAGRILALRVLDRALPAAESRDAALLLPRHLGQVLPAGEGLPHARGYRANDLTLAMCGVLRGGRALLASWTGEETVLTTHLEARDSPRFPVGRAWSLSLDLPPEPAALELRALGTGGLEAVASAYRRVADARGLRRTWASKKAECPRIEALEGAPVFRFPCLVRSAARTRFNPGPHEIVARSYTFDEVARCAQHWRDVLGVERAHVVVSGWGREGYDRGHPDVLPANAESGGDTALAECAARVASLGYVFTLHDNYNDAYRDAPSWDPAVLRRDEHGVARPGGQWAGGQSWRVCPTEQVRFARRNLPRIAQTYRPDGIFLDTTLTPALEPCHDARHPLTRATDASARRDLYAVARGEFGLLGLEGAAEWAVPEAAWFEGLLTHKTVHRPGWIVVPLFPMVFGDCLTLVPIQADKLDVDDARKVLDLALYGAMPSFELGAHLYFAEPLGSIPVRAEIARIEAQSDRRFRLAVRWHADGAIGDDFVWFVHVTRADSPNAEGVDVQHVWRPARPTSTWAAGDTYEDWCAPLELPAAAEGPWEIRVGAIRGGRRFALEGCSTADRRTTLGVLRRDGGALIVDTAPSPARDDTFARADGGWAAGLCPTDRLIKNVVETLGPLCRLVAGRPMTRHAFLAADRSVERTEFGDVVVTVNYGEDEHQVGSVRLPRHGLLVESPTFLAFHATRFRGTEYPGGALFTLRSLDGLPLATSRSIRVFHGFGPARIGVRGEVVEVPRELVWRPR